MRIPPYTRATVHEVPGAAALLSEIASLMAGHPRTIFMTLAPPEGAQGPDEFRAKTVEASVLGLRAVDHTEGKDWNMYFMIRRLAEAGPIPNWMDHFFDRTMQLSFRMGEGEGVVSFKDE